MNVDDIEKLAKAIHENYVKEQAATGNANAPSAVPWEKLPEEFKESNRNAARSFEDKLHSIGMAIDDGGRAPSRAVAIDHFDAATLLQLSKAEHDRWANEKLANGWTYAPVRDNALKHHPMLIPFDRLPLAEQQKDTNVVNNIIPLLRSVGLKVVKQ